MHIDLPVLAALPARGDARPSPSQPALAVPGDLWERLAGFERAVADAERAALACDPINLGRFRDAFPAAMEAVGPHVEDLRDHRTPGVRVAAWRCRLFVCEALVTLGAGCHPSLAMADRRWAFDRCRYLLATAARRRAALPADALAARISDLLSASAGLRFADVLRGSGVADVPRLGRMRATVEAGRRLGQRLLGRASA